MTSPDRQLDDLQIDLEMAARLFPSLADAMRWAKSASPHALHGWLLFLAAQNLGNTNQLLEEMKKMASNDDQLTQAVQDLLQAFTDNTAAIEAEIASLKSAGLDGADPAITASVASIENIVAQMKQSTAAAQAAIALPAGDGSGDGGSGSTPPAGDGDGSGDGTTGDQGQGSATDGDSSTTSATE